MRKSFFTLLIIAATLLANAQSGQVQLANQYYAQGDIDKALPIYERLAKNDQNIPLIHQNYLTILLDLQKYKEAEKYIDKALKRFPDNSNYAVDKGIIYLSKGDEEEAKEYFNTLIERVAVDNFKTRRTVQYMLSRQLIDYAVLTLNTARYVFCLISSL